MDLPFKEPDKSREKSDAFMRGFERAERQFYADEDNWNFVNPFVDGSDEHAGFEEAVYILTQK